MQVNKTTISLVKGISSVPSNSEDIHLSVGADEKFRYVNSSGGVKEIATTQDLNTLESQNDQKLDLKLDTTTFAALSGSSGLQESDLDTLTSPIGTTANISGGTISATSFVGSGAYLTDLPNSGSGVNTYEQTIGDNSSTTIVVTHGLDTVNIIHSLRDTITGEIVLADAELTDNNTITFTFSVAPTTDEFTVIVLSATGSSFAGNVTTDILPSISGAWDIGSLALPFKDLYLTNNSLHLGNTKISIVNGNLNVGGEDLSSTDLDATSIKSLYESNADTNAFTDLFKTKLENTDISEVNFTKSGDDITGDVDRSAPNDVISTELYYSSPVWANKRVAATEYGVGALSSTDASLSAGGAVTFMFEIFFNSEVIAEFMSNSNNLQGNGGFSFTRTATNGEVLFNVNSELFGPVGAGNSRMITSGASHAVVGVWHRYMIVVPLTGYPKLYHNGVFVQQGTLPMIGAGMTTSSYQIFEVDGRDFKLRNYHLVDGEVTNPTVWTGSNRSELIGNGAMTDRIYAPDGNMRNSTPTRTWTGVVHPVVGPEFANSNNLIPYDFSFSPAEVLEAPSISVLDNADTEVLEANYGIYYSTDGGTTVSIEYNKTTFSALGNLSSSASYRIFIEPKLGQDIKSVTMSVVASASHGTGLVTEHSDVNDAGSGDIITAAERTKVGNAVESIAGTPPGGDKVTNIISLTQTEYNAATKDASTFYIIVGA